MTGTAGQPPLDEVMLAMDVVDTLRHRERIVERALSVDDRDQELIGRLREIYAGQGIEVSDSVITQGVRDLRADRFRYTPPAPSFGRTLARIYVSRNRWGWPVGLAVTAAATLLISYQMFVRGPEMTYRAEMPQIIESLYTTVTDLAESPDVDIRAESIRNGGQYAVENGDFDGARTAIADLESLSEILEQVYEVRVLSRPGEDSGVWRVPDANPDAQNFYLIVEAIDPDGGRLRLPVTNEETERTQNVTRWGQRVDAATFDRIKNDKLDDGIIQNAIIGSKRRGVLETEFLAGVLDGAITDW